MKLYKQLAAILRLTKAGIPKKVLACEKEEEKKKPLQVRSFHNSKDSHTKRKCLFRGREDQRAHDRGMRDDIREKDRGVGDRGCNANIRRSLFLHLKKEKKKEKHRDSTNLDGCVLHAGS